MREDRDRIATLPAEPEARAASWGSRSGRRVDELAMPELEDEQRPDALGVVRGPACVVIEHALHEARVEVAAASRPVFEQHVAGELAQVLTEPVGQRWL